MIHQNIILEPFNEGDFDNLISWIKNEEFLIQFSGQIFQFPLTKEQLFDYLNDEKRIAFKVIEKLSNKVIGHAELYKSGKHEMKIARVLIGDESNRSKGYGKQIILELTKYAFNLPDIETVVLNVFDWNISAIKCYEKVGFKFKEGISKKIIVGQNVWISLTMVIHENQWDKLKTINYE